MMWGTRDTLLAIGCRVERRGLLRRPISPISVPRRPSSTCTIFGRYVDLFLELFFALGVGQKHLRHTSGEVAPHPPGQIYGLLAKWLMRDPMATSVEARLLQFAVGPSGPRSPSQISFLDTSFSDGKTYARVRLKRTGKRPPLSISRPFQAGRELPLRFRNSQ
ncbi:MAG: hypothetical protein Q9170_001198 [Blastenia crenularia]